MLYETYRPKCWADLVGQDKAKTVARRIIDRPGFDRGAFWIECGGENNSGVGKTTLALLIARQLADEFFIEQISGAKVDKAAAKRMEQAAYLCTWSDKPFRVVVIDEAHAISQGAIDILLPLLEGLPKHFVVIFTTTRKVDEGLFGTDDGPFASRCHKLRLTNQGLAQAFAERARSIAEREGLNGRPIGDYVKLVRDCKNNLRRVLQRIEEGEMLEATP